jgi:hypothetical protein
MPQCSDHDARAGNAVQNQKHHRLDRVAHQKWAWFPVEHQRDDQRQFDDRYREGEYQRPIRLPQSQRDQFGMMHRGQHTAD